MKLFKYAAVAACVLSPLSAQAQEYYISQVIWLATNYCPEGTIPANGQILNVMDNQALFALVGSTYGGDGRTNFAVPDLRAANPVGAGNQVRTGQIIKQTSCTPKAGENTSGIECTASPVSSLALTPCIVGSRGLWPTRP